MTAEYYNQVYLSLIYLDILYSRQFPSIITVIYVSTVYGNTM